MNNFTAPPWEDHSSVKWSLSRTNNFNSCKVPPQKYSNLHVSVNVKFKSVCSKDNTIKILKRSKILLLKMLKIYTKFSCLWVVLALTCGRQPSTHKLLTNTWPTANAYILKWWCIISYLFFKSQITSCCFRCATKLLYFTPPRVWHTQDNCPRSRSSGTFFFRC